MIDFLAQWSKFINCQFQMGKLFPLGDLIYLIEDNISNLGYFLLFVYELTLNVTQDPGELRK